MLRVNHRLLRRQQRHRQAMARAIVRTHLMAKSHFGSKTRHSCMYYESTHVTLVVIRKNENWLLVLTGTTTLVGVVGLGYVTVEKYKESDYHKYNVIKRIMMQPIGIEPLTFPELYAKNQVDMMRKFVFSKETSLVLIEGAQGKPARLHMRQ